MVVVSFSQKELQEKLGLKGKEWKKELEETLFKIGMELEEANEEEIAIDIAGAGNRIDTVSLEGVVRVVRAYQGKYSFKYPKLARGKAVVNVDKGVLPLRPYIGAFIVRGIELNDENLRRVINYQDKIHATFGRDRSMLAMGVYKLSGIKFPLQFTALPISEIKFAPLGFTEEMAASEILAKHEKGKAYAHLLNGQSKLPVFRDKDEIVLALIPVTNSNEVGKVEPGKQDLLIEASGFNDNLLRQLLCANALDFAEMGGTIETVTVKYPDRKLEFPEWDFERYSLEVKQCNELLGLDLKPAKIIALLKKMMFESSARGSQLNVSVPRFRSDVLHAVDIVEDVARAYGFDLFKPEAPTVHTFGKKHAKTKLFNEVINAFTGLEFQQVVGMILAGKEAHTAKINRTDDGKFAELFSSRALGLNCCRRSLAPGLLEIIASNKEYSYPQRIFEVGECLEVDASQETGARTVWKAGGLIAGADSSFATVKAVVEALARCLDDYELKIEAVKDAMFIKGRAAKVNGKYFSGTFGEVDLQILRNYGIEMPCALVEVELKQ